MTAPVVALLLILLSIALLSAGAYLVFGLGATLIFMGAATLCVAVIAARGAAAVE